MLDREWAWETVLSARRDTDTQEKQKPLRTQRPEKSTGSFDPVPCSYHILRSRTAYSLSSTASDCCFGQASRVPFAGRSRRQRMAKPSHPNIDRGVEQLLEAVFAYDRNLRCPGCPGGVLGENPFSRDTPPGSLRSSTRQTHSNFSKVSWVSWVITDTIACVTCAQAHVTWLNGFSKQPGHPGHPKNLTQKTRGSSPETHKSGVPESDRFTQDTPGHPGRPAPVMEVAA